MIYPTNIAQIIANNSKPNRLIPPKMITNVIIPMKPRMAIASPKPLNERIIAQIIPAIIIIVLNIPNK